MEKCNGGRCGLLEKKYNKKMAEGMGGEMDGGINVVMGGWIERWV